MGLHPGLFDFESGYAEDLRFIPLSVRYRLDLEGLKIGLEAWRGFPMETRRSLAALAEEGRDADRAFRPALLEACAGNRMPAPEPVAALDPAAWSASAPPPAEAMHPRVASGWPGLDDLRRYALFKLARSRREPDALARALREFLGGG